MLDKIRKYIADNNMLDIGDKVVVGVSGGADSTALLHILCMLKEEYGLSIFVVHINHGIREEAGEDAAYVEKLCKEQGLSFRLFEKDIPALAKKEHLSEEEAGRKFRYECFEKVIKDCGGTKLALAHHLDDQAETVLFRLVRGTDISGMAGMSPVSVSSSGTYIIRPLLCVRRKEITDWLIERDIKWQEDVTNKDDHYARNRIRNNILTELSKVNDAAALHIAEFASLSADYDSYIKRQALEYISDNMVSSKDDGQIKIERDHLLGEDKVLIYRVLYEMLVMTAGARKDITKDHVGILVDMLRKTSGRKVNLPYNVIAYTSYDWLILCKDCDENEDETFDELKIELDDIITKRVSEVEITNGKLVFSIIETCENIDTENLQKNYTKYFDCDTIRDTLYIRHPKSGDYLICDNDGHRKRLSKLFKDIKLPATERGRVPVLASGDEILWAIGYRRCEAHHITSDTERVLKVEYII